MTIIYILISTLLIAFIAFAGALTLFFKKELINKILLILVSFASGSLIGGAFLHLIPESIEEMGSENLLPIFLYVILGFIVFFVLEQFISWHHCHKTEHEAMPFSYLILISDAVHNLIDGLIIAGSFIVSFPVGVATALAVAFHEIPQEIGDFGILVYGGFKRSKALVLNFISAIAVVLGGLIGYLISGQVGEYIVYLLPFAAGNFIYIASADLIPEIKKKCEVKKSLFHFLSFLAGILFMLLIKLI
jgi:zinc and cadmium transporter